MLKQNQYVPMDVAEQVAIIFAATSGGIDKVPAPQVQEFEKSFLSHVRANHGDLLERIRTEGKWSDELAASFTKVIEDHVKEFTA